MHDRFFTVFSDRRHTKAMIVVSVPPLLLKVRYEHAFFHITPGQIFKHRFIRDRHRIAAQSVAKIKLIVSV